jgi:sulfur carrier protein
VWDAITHTLFYDETNYGGEIMVKINGELSMSEVMVLAEYLQQNGYDTKRIAVERNGEIVPKSQYEVTVLQENDSLEIVSFVGGG